MRTRLGVLLAAGVLATAGSVVPAAAAGPGPASSGASAGAVALSNLTITKTGPSWAGSLNKQVTLQCEPTGGTHPTAADACGKLLAVDGQFDKLQPSGTPACPPVWMPTTVTVTGTWRWQPVSFTRTYSSDCDAGVRSDYVFRF
ncbi:SSI family serine proteinase inhibitor [Streptomyces fragilis]|uniref:SSI family serine proteinase inhibitor n=1 Tax=Streptomyces fragilis TaxID=67301 RepID=A0ABV2YHF7_9ACTN|nr:SSI family serine proteinase inhibitor [Streptomyces fragilis]